MAEFPEIVGLGFEPGLVKHYVCHHATIDEMATNFNPGAPRRLDPQKYTAAKAEFERMEKAGIVRQSNSPWSFALQPDGSWHPCGDFP